MTMASEKRTNLNYSYDANLGVSPKLTPSFRN